MKIVPDQKLFWFLKGDVELDLADPAVLDMYVQQVITHGRTKDVTALLENVDFEQFRQVFLRLKHFVPFEIRKFWEDFIGSYKQSSKSNTP